MPASIEEVSGLVDWKQTQGTRAPVEQPRLVRTVQVNSVAPLAHFSMTSVSPAGMPLLGQVEQEPQDRYLEAMRPSSLLGIVRNAAGPSHWFSFHSADISALQQLRPPDHEKVEFTPDAVALLKSAGALHDAKSLALDLHRIVPATTLVIVRVLTDPEFGDDTMNIVVHTSAPVDVVLGSDHAVNERLFRSRTYGLISEVAVTYEFEGL